MASYVTPKKNVAFIVYVSLASQANGNIMQANPTLAAGDFKVSIDGGALNNLTTLPTVTPASGKMVKISLSSSEMNGDNITVVCSDAAGAEWRDLVINIQTSASQIDDLATASALATVQADTDDIQTRLPSALVSGRIDASVGAMASAVITATAIATDAIGAAELASDAVTEIAGAVWDVVMSSHVTAGTFGAANQGLRSATAQAGAAGTITLDASASATDNLYNGAIVAIISGTGAGQARLITAYVGSTKVATISPNWTTNPSSSSIFVIFPAGYVAGLVSVLSGAITSGSFAAGAIDAAAIATDAIGSAELAASAVTEIQSGLATSSALSTVDSNVSAIKTKTDNLPVDPADASDVAALIAGLNNISVANILAGVIEGSYTLKDALRLLLAAEVGKVSGGGTTSVAFRDTGDTKNRISATIDSNGNRTAVTLDAT